MQLNGSSVTVWHSQKLAGFPAVFGLVFCLTLLKTRITFDNGLFDYHLRCTEITLWNMNNNKTNFYLCLTFEQFTMTLCNFSKYLAKLTLCFDIVNFTSLKLGHILQKL